MKAKLVNNGEYVSIDDHKLHILRIGDESKPKLVFMAGSGTFAPIYDFKILYSKLVNDFRIIVIEKFGYGYSDLYEASCDIDSLLNIQREELQKIGESGPFILVPHSMSGLEALRWKQKYPDEVQAIIGLDMATPTTYFEWSKETIDKKIKAMRKSQKIMHKGLLDWYPLYSKGLSRDERIQQRLLWMRNAMNDCYINEAEKVLENAKAVAATGIVKCKSLLFVSNGKQISANWIGNQQQLADEMGAELVQLGCGHYVHHFESQKISEMIIDFIK